MNSKYPRAAKLDAARIPLESFNWSRQARHVFEAFGIWGNRLWELDSLWDFSKLFPPNKVRQVKGVSSLAVYEIRDTILSHVPAENAGEWATWGEKRRKE